MRSMESNREYRDYTTIKAIWLNKPAIERICIKAGQYIRHPLNSHWKPTQTINWNERIHKCLSTLFIKKAHASRNFEKSQYYKTFTEKLGNIFCWQVNETWPIHNLGTSPDVDGKQCVIWEDYSRWEQKDMVYVYKTIANKVHESTKQRMKIKVM